MNWSAGVVADVTEPSVTVTSTGPAACGGETAVIEVGLTVTVVAEVPPKLTVAVDVKLVPLIVTVVPPAAVPVPGEMPVTVGAGGAGGVGVV